MTIKLYKIYYSRYFLVYSLIIPISNNIIAQYSKNDTVKISSNLSGQIDINDLYKYVFKKEAAVKKDSSKLNLKGPFFTIIPYPGYAIVTGYLFGFVSNISFYTDKVDNARLSSILMSNIYSQYKQFMNIINSNIWLNHELINLTGDWRYYQFPTYTYGRKTTLSDADAIDYSRFRFYEVAMSKLTNNIFAGAGINFETYWNINEILNPPKIAADYDDMYKLTNSSVSSGISINFQFDDRLNSNNPSKGTYFNVQYRDNLKELGSTVDWQSLVIDARHYFPLTKRSGNVLAVWSYDWLTLSGMPPYLDLPATGEDSYNNTARGYVEGRFRGLNLLYLEAEYRFHILNNGLLGGVLFSNATAVSEWPGNKFERINPGNGVGIRIKMNKASSTNLCVDYGIGTGGSKGFIFNLNEVF
jgi:hypothetical protein